MSLGGGVVGTHLGGTQNCLGDPGHDLLWVSTAVAGAGAGFLEAGGSQESLASGWKRPKVLGGAGLQHPSLRDPSETLEEILLIEGAGTAA